MGRKFILAIVALVAFAQVASAQFYIGGSVQFNAQFQEDHPMAIGLAPDLGVNLGDWCIGAAFGLSANRNNVSGWDGFSFSVTPYAEYFFWESGPVSFYIEGGVGLTWDKWTEEGERSPSRAFSCSPYIAPGICFSLSEHWDVMGLIGGLEYDTATRSLSIGNSGFSDLSIGLFYTF